MKKLNDKASEQPGGSLLREAKSAERTSAAFLHPALQLQRSIGNRAVSQLLQRQCAGCAEEREQEQPVQRQAEPSSHQTPPAAADIVPRHSRGEPLDDRTRGFMESRLNADFSSVRVHTDAPAAAAAQAIDATAFTTGNDIYFASGKYAPHQSDRHSDGQRLLAHELAHTVQQGQGQSPTKVSCQTDGVSIGHPDDPLEQQADVAADRAMAAGAQTANVVTQAPQGIIQRQKAPGTTGGAGPVIVAIQADWHSTSATATLSDGSQISLSLTKNALDPGENNFTFGFGPVSGPKDAEYRSFTCDTGTSCPILWTQPANFALPLDVKISIKRPTAESASQRIARLPDYIQDYLHSLGGDDLDFLAQYGEDLVKSGTKKSDLAGGDIKVEGKAPKDQDFELVKAARAGRFSTFPTFEEFRKDLERKTLRAKDEARETSLTPPDPLEYQEWREQPQEARNKWDAFARAEYDKALKDEAAKLRYMSEYAGKAQNAWLEALGLSAALGTGGALLGEAGLALNLGARTGLTAAQMGRGLFVSGLTTSFGFNLYNRGKEAKAANMKFLSTDSLKILSSSVTDTLEVGKINEAITDKSSLTGQDLGRSVGERIFSGALATGGALMNAAGVGELAGGDLPPVPRPGAKPPSGPPTDPLALSSPPETIPLTTDADLPPAINKDLPVANDTAPTPAPTTAQAGADTAASQTKWPVDELAARRAAIQAKALEEAKALELQQAQQAQSGRIRAAAGGSGGGGDVVATTTPVRPATSGAGTGARPATPAFSPGATPKPAEVIRILRNEGLNDAEIAGLSSKGTKQPGPVSAPLVVRLGEHFTAEDLKELGAALDKAKVALTDEMVTDLIDSVPPGEMKDLENILRRGAQENPMQPQPDEGFDPSGTGARIDRPGPPRQPDPSRLPAGYQLAETQARRALETEFGAGWEKHPVFRARGAGQNESLGSTIPEYYNSRLNMAAEVKRWNPEGLGIAQDGKIISTTPEEGLTKAIGDAEGQLATRRQNLPATQIVIFNITGYGVTNIPAVGAAIRNLIEANGVLYDRVFLQNGFKLTEIL